MIKILEYFEGWDWYNLCVFTFWYEIQIALRSVLGWTNSSCRLSWQAEAKNCQKGQFFSQKLPWDRVKGPDVSTPCCLEDHEAICGLPKRLGVIEYRCSMMDDNTGAQVKKVYCFDWHSHLFECGFYFVRRCLSAGEKRQVHEHEGVVFSTCGRNQVQSSAVGPRSRRAKPPMSAAAANQKRGAQRFGKQGRGHRKIELKMRDCLCAGHHTWGLVGSKSTPIIV